MAEPAGSCNRQERTKSGRTSLLLTRATRNRRHQQHFVSIAEDVCRPTEEADVLLIHINIEEAAHLSSLVADMRFQFRKLLVEDREQFSQIRGRARDRAYARRVPPQCGRNLYSDRHLKPPSLRAYRRRCFFRDLNRVQRFV